MASDVDLPAYFDRIGYGGPTNATLERLQAVVTAHVRSVPFENLDPLMGVPVADLGPAALGDKIVRRRRGGFCDEQNGLMGYVLAALGYDVVALGGRVVWMQAGGPLPAETHQVLAVTIPGTVGPFLVDVGFGGQTQTSPIRLEAGLVQDTCHERFRIRHGEAGGYVLKSEIRGADRSRGRMLVCLNASHVRVRRRSQCGNGHRRRPMELAGSQPRRSPTGRTANGRGSRTRRRCSTC